MAWSLTSRSTIFLFALSSILLVVREDAASADEPRSRPNIVVIVADDLGYGELGCYGGKEIPTPNIDSLARNGVRCTSGYVSCPVCSPTRAGLLTGRYQQRFGHEFNPGPAQRAPADFGLPLTEKTMADYLKDAGYATGMVGKWHLGYQGAYLPLKRGFQEFYGFLGGAHPYQRSRNGREIFRGTKVVDETDYLTDAFGREALAFIDRHQKEPFFLYWTFNAVHNPLQASKKYLDRFPEIKDEKRRTFAAMLSAMDDAIGSVLKKLREAELEENTLVFFISDNGGPTRQTTSRNDPLSGFKGQVREGGIRVPFLVQWKGHLQAGQTYNQPVIALDILPTALAASSTRPVSDNRLDGIDLLPYFTNERKNKPHEYLYWRYGNQLAVRAGEWKLVKIDSQPSQLFNLKNDLAEKYDLAAQDPDKAKELEAALNAWNATLAEPRWRRANR